MAGLPSACSFMATKAQESVTAGRHSASLRQAWSTGASHVLPGQRAASADEIGGGLLEDASIPACGAPQLHTASAAAASSHDGRQGIRRWLGMRGVSASRLAPSRRQPSAQHR